MPLIYIAVIALAIIALQQHFHIKNFHVVETEILYTSGQPRGMDYTRLLYKYHIGTFINIRSAAEHREQNWYNEELIWMRKNGVNYIELPIEKRDLASGFPDAQTQKIFLEIMEDKSNLPVLIHDDSGRKRVARLAAVWMISAGNYTIKDTSEKITKIKQQSLTPREAGFLNAIYENSSSRSTLPQKQ